MIRFQCYKRSNDRTPVIRDIDIVRYARNVLRDYSPENLESPVKLNTDHFLEHYLRANVEVQHIYTETRRDIIAGAAIFDPQIVKVFDKENMTTANILFPQGTVLIDEWTDKESPFGFRAFTMMHEAGHLMMHQEVYGTNAGRNDSNGYGSIAAREITVNNAALCKRSMIGSYYSGKGLVTSEDFREHQANTFAGAMLMPPATFIPYVQSLIDEQGYNNSGMFIVFPRDTFMKTYNDFRKIKFRTARKFGVSPTAVEVQMKKYGLWTTAREFKEARQRLRMYQNI